MALMRCPECRSENVGEMGDLQAVAVGRWDDDPNLHFEPDGYTTVDYDSFQPDKQAPCFCTDCLWQGEPGELERNG